MVHDPAGIEDERSGNHQRTGEQRDHRLPVFAPLASPTAAKPTTKERQLQLREDAIVAGLMGHWSIGVGWSRCLR
jgi:hypothetical protein